MSEEPRSIPWSLVGIVALAAFALVLPAAMPRQKGTPYREADEWMDAYVRGCLADDHQPV